MKKYRTEFWRSIPRCTTRFRRFWISSIRWTTRIRSVPSTSFCIGSTPIRQSSASCCARPVCSRSSPSFEDLHWNDSLTLGLLNELVVAARDARLLLIVDLPPGIPGRMGDQSNYRQLRLGSLGKRWSRGVPTGLLGPDPSLHTLKSFLAERASGNPFFVEEIVRSVVDTGVLDGERGSYRLARPFSGIEVPPTVRAVLAARIDALPATDKHLLEEAAVIGHNVPFTLLHAICGLTEDEASAYSRQSPGC